jgi:hypothetical protein
MTTTASTLSRSTKGKGKVIEGNNLNPKGNEIIKTDLTSKESDTTSSQPDEKAIELAKANLEKAKISYEHAKQALALLTGKASKEPKGDGVIGTIFNLIKDSGKSGISKAQILASLVSKFPDRTEEGMNKTIQVQLCSRMSKERGVNIVKENDLYLIK